MSQHSVIRRLTFLLITAVFAVIFCVSCTPLKAPDQTESADPTDSSVSQKSVSSDTVSEPVDTRPEYVKRGKFKLNAKYTDLLLVNGENPLPDDYNVEERLTTIKQKYREPGYDLDQINKKVYPYLRAMCEAAEADGVHLAVCSPYRSYEIQEVLYNRQVDIQIANGLKPKAARRKAATIVAKPGTSEHQTGLACDFIKADDVFETMPAFQWLQENAADYGFIMRYPKEKEAITGVIYESWHYRFVGIYKAQEIKETGLCLEEYLEQYGS